MLSDPLADRFALYSANRLKLGLFGANCSSGRAVTTLPERWSGSWDDNLALARMAEAAGLEFLLPVGRWRGYGGRTDYQGETLETVTWATGLLAATERITVFGTVHAPLIHPLVAAKQFVTADHIGRGRFGLNVVCGWNADEFEMFGAELRAHDDRYTYAGEWLEAVTRAWGNEESFDLDGASLRLRGVRAKPKPYGGTRPVVMNAAASPAGQAFALRWCDALFSMTSLGTLDEFAAHIRAVTGQARALGRAIDVYTVAVVTCRPTRAEAEAAYRHAMIDHADWDAVDAILAMRGVTRASHPDFERHRQHQVNGLGGLPIIGDPDDVAAILARLGEMGTRGVAISFVNYLEELPLFRDAVLPRLARMGWRAAA